MSTMPRPAKQDIPNELWRVASTLTQEAQDAALRKCRELGFDISRGHIPLGRNVNQLEYSKRFDPGCS